MELWSDIRRRVLTGEMNMQQACSEYGINFSTAEKIVQQAEQAAQLQSERYRSHDRHHDVEQELDMTFRTLPRKGTQLIRYFPLSPSPSDPAGQPSEQKQNA